MSTLCNLTAEEIVHILAYTLSCLDQPVQESICTIWEIENVRGERKRRRQETKKMGRERKGIFRLVRWRRKEIVDLQVNS